MGSCCGGTPPTSKAGTVTGYKVITMTGEEKGPYLTATEARIAVAAAGGGVVTPIH